MKVNRKIHDGNFLFDYYIDKTGSHPVLVIRDLMDESGVVRCQEFYRPITYNICYVIDQIAYLTGCDVEKMAIVYCDTYGSYSGVNLLGGSTYIYNLHNGQHTTDEKLAIDLARIAYAQRVERMGTILSQLPMGRIEQFSYVELHFDEHFVSYWVPGYPSHEEIKISEPYHKMEQEYPHTQCATVEIVSYQIYNKASPASQQLMLRMADLGYDLVRHMENVSQGDAALYTEDHGILAATGQGE